MNTKNSNKTHIPHSNWQPEIDRAMAALSHGGIILYPTDTIWGLGVDACDSAAVMRLYRLKSRDVSKKMISLIPTDQSIFRYVAAPPVDILDTLASFDRPTSIIYPDVLELAAELLDEHRGALRVVHSRFAKALLVQYDRPIVATSANFSGQPSPKFYEQIDPKLKQQLDYCAPPELGDASMTHTESQLFRLPENGRLEQIR